MASRVTETSNEAASRKERPRAVKDLSKMEAEEKTVRESAVRPTMDEEGSSSEEEESSEEYPDTSIVPGASGGLKVSSESQVPKRMNIDDGGDDGDDEGSDKKPKLTSSEKRKLERLQRENKTGANYYATHNVKNKNRERKKDPDSEKAFRGHMKKDVKPRRKK